MIKNIFILMSVLLLLMVGVMTSCSSDDDDTVETLTVASVYGYMNYFGEPHKCYLVKENGNVTVESGNKLTIKNGYAGVEIPSGFECKAGAEFVIE